MPGGHRQIDMLLMSRPLAASADVHWDLEGPWAQPRTGMWAELDVTRFNEAITIFQAPPEIEIAAGSDLPWETHRAISHAAAIEGARRLRERARAEEPPFQDDVVDEHYVRFMVAAEHLLTARKPDVDYYGAAMHRGWPLEVRQVALQPARPSGWLAKPSGLAAWAALAAIFQGYIAAITKGMSRKIDQNERGWRSNLREYEAAIGF